jgi:hypothetical protein
MRYLQIYKKIFLVTVASWLLLPTAGMAQRSVSKTTSTSVVVAQTINGLTTPSSTMVATIGPTLFLGSDLATSSRVAEKESSIASNISPVSFATYAAGTTRGDIIGQATTTLSLQIPILKTQLSAYAKLKGASNITLNFDQEVAIPGSASTARLFWSYSLIDGREVYGSPVIVNSNPHMLYAIYYSKNVMSGLPSAFARANGGILQYQITKTDGTPISEMTSIDVGGIFDSPQSTAGGPAVDLDAGLKCLINPAAGIGCAAGQPSIVGLINQTSATSAVLDYVRMVAPIYQTVTSPAGVVSEIAQMSLNVTNRTLTSNTCHYTYRNVGSYAYDLSTKVDRYYVQPDGSYNYINQYLGRSWSPSLTYDYSVKVLPSQVGTLPSLIIDPTGITSNLISITDVALMAELAPITDVGSFSPSMGSWTSQCRVHRAWVSFSAVCDATTGSLVVDTRMDCNGGTTPNLRTNLSTEGTWYGIQMSRVSGDNAPKCGGGYPWSAMVDATNNLWINSNGCGGSSDTGQDITLRSYRSIFYDSFTAPKTQSCTQYDEWGNPYESTCTSEWQYQTKFLGINLNNGQPITATEEIGPVYVPPPDSGGGG